MRHFAFRFILQFPAILEALELDPNFREQVSGGPTVRAEEAPVEPVKD